MTINTRLEFDGNAPNNSRLQQVLDELANAISSLNGGTIGSPLTIVGPTNNMVLSGSPAATAISITATGGDPSVPIAIFPKGPQGFVQMGPDTYGAAGWSGSDTNVEIYQLSSPTASPFGIYLEKYAGDIAGTALVGLQFKVGTQSAGATQDITNITGVAGDANNSLPTGRTVSVLSGGHFTAFHPSGAATTTEGFGVITSVGIASSGSIQTGYGYYTNIGDLTTSSGTNKGYGYYARFTNATPVAEAYGFWAEDLGGKATNSYALWSNTQGVYRIRADNTFDSVYQSIAALYNPQFTKYTAGAANFERGVLGQWTGNVFQITTEKGGTGTLRGMQIGATTATPLGFYGKTPIACAVLATGAGATVDNVITALQNLGLVKQS